MDDFYGPAAQAQQLRRQRMSQMAQQMLQPAPQAPMGGGMAPGVPDVGMGQGGGSAVNPQAMMQIAKMLKGTGKDAPDDPFAGGGYNLPAAGPDNPPQAAAERPGFFQRVGNYFSSGG